jgi:glycosyltransferase involved in cell wall biosynthesis
MDTAPSPRIARGADCVLTLVVPCFNEEEVLPETACQLSALLARLCRDGLVSWDSRVLFVDDGSTDGTWALIESLSQRDPALSGIKLSRNRGHQNALLAGLFTAEGDVIVSIDADLQDDIEVIGDMVRQHHLGAEVVYGVREHRNADSAFKRLTAVGFYRLMKLLGADSISNHADFRLMSRRAVEALKQFGEVNLFLRGIVPLIGFRSAIVRYDRLERRAGVTKYPLRRMLGLALDAITSFSVVPLRIITFIGFVVFLLSAAMGGWALWAHLFSDQTLPGWTSTILPIYFLGGVQILCIGILGEYMGKLYQEAKARPRYIIEKITQRLSSTSAGKEDRGQG